MESPCNLRSFQLSLALHALQQPLYQSPLGKWVKLCLPLSSCGEMGRRPASLLNYPTLNSLSSSKEADRTGHPSLLDTTMPNSSNISSVPTSNTETNQGHNIHSFTAQVSTLGTGCTPLAARDALTERSLPTSMTTGGTVSATLPSGTALMLPKSVSVTRMSMKIYGVNHHFMLFLLTGNQPLAGPNPAMLVNSGDLYLHQYHLNTQIWVKETSGWVIGWFVHLHSLLVDH
ncbi:hypothetical protein F5J12DRAFT_783035 [Pisolithus orientalis]|uniref:uncharacterized protein n=1 Tax=Pisolithus orientalis TaxID=936130 RepID=UPI002224F7F6|nr:uncharacterized protein F5J12DRAFT_783035 [Pisolithus orientalis]KAI6006262.1 hypothetical protein F5J12DRAFT_783035 [Pisolithus orientalis]